MQQTLACGFLKVCVTYCKNAFRPSINFQPVNVVLVMMKKLLFVRCRLAFCVAVWLVSPNGFGHCPFPLVQIPGEVLCVDEKAGGETGGAEFW